MMNEIEEIKDEIEETVDVDDYSKICRTCLSTEDLECIFNLNFEDQPFATIFKDCLPLQLEKNDDLPQKMCKNCIGELCNYYCFITKCKETEKILKSMLKPLTDNEYVSSEVVIKDETKVKIVDIETLKKEQAIEMNFSEKSYLCEVCQRGFCSKDNLKRHIMKHTNEFAFRCDVCDKGFVQKSTLLYHKQSHTNNTTEKKQKSITPSDYKHECKICKVRFAHKSSVATHLLSHCDKTFLCDECGKKFITQQALKFHRNIHFGIKPYVCQECFKTFTYQHSLTQHMLIHTGEKPFVCEVCSKRFTQYSHLRYHLRIHSGDKPYSCDICSKSFAVKGNLTVHKRIHTGETPYLCPICGKGFYNTSGLKKHKITHQIKQGSKIKKKYNKNMIDLV